jgi:hypothetical protein
MSTVACLRWNVPSLLQKYSWKSLNKLRFKTWDSHGSNCKDTLLWNVTFYLVDSYRSFGETCSFLLQGRRISDKRWMIQGSGGGKLDLRVNGREWLWVGQWVAVVLTVARRDSGCEWVKGKWLVWVCEERNVGMSIHTGCGGRAAVMAV